ncbi:unnamed protein product [Spirodela intermedia]|uniref:Uncharacterized protein n=1 Tax=Spirodela intermedia TaxID=51605 RepID=A0A7I8J8X9_SPIIN|nr:unnamed protein product [Spirodela intermedia]CAA6666676.1 unnamed protein product [Spirodela intermedia]
MATLAPLSFGSYAALLLFLLGGAAAGGGRWTSWRAAPACRPCTCSSSSATAWFSSTARISALGASLDSGRCRDDPYDTALPHDCTAHAAEYHVASGSLRPLTLATDSWCSSGTVSAAGVLIQTGGFNDGDRTVRMLRPCADCDWEEKPAVLAAGADLSPSAGTSSLLYDLPFLRQTREKGENNLYPFVHLNVDGNLFIFANKDAILLDYRRNVILKTFPQMPGGGPRNYPSTGSSVLLPLGPSGAEAEVLVCGGAPTGSFQRAWRGVFQRALDTCGRIKITDHSPEWAMEEMPVLILNGVERGTAGWELGRDPVLSPVTYQSDGTPGSRFRVEASATMPRVYHSSAALLRDGRVLVGGSNPHAYYNFTGVLFPTDTSLESFSPEYLSDELAAHRPVILPPHATALSYGGDFSVRFSVAAGLGKAGVRVTMWPILHDAFLRHEPEAAGRGLRSEGHGPRSANLAPPGFYMLFVVNGNVPSVGVWVHIK